MHYIGAHTIDNGGIHMAVRRAAQGKMRALQVFTAIPKYYNEKVGVRPERAERFRVALAESGIEARHVVAHAAYVHNAATADEPKWQRARAGLTKEVERAVTLGIGAVCFHPGSAGTSPPEDAIERIAMCITYALQHNTGATRLLVENTAGAGRTMARTAAEVGGILSQVPAELRARTGYGLDTCHLFSSGYDIRASRSAFEKILDEFEARTGEAPSFFHLNDSEGALGSNRDRHTLIGEGAIGTEPFAWLLADRRSQNVPLILETPQERLDIEDEDDSPDPYDVRMMKLLAGLTA
jgi:deoxyribonuclease-4